MIMGLSFFCSLNGRDTEKADTVEVIDGFNNLYRFRNFYLAGQPTLEELKWIRSEGVTRIINLRSADENNKFSESAFNEETIAKELGFEYHSLPVNGYKDFTPEKLDTFIHLINRDEKTLIHCAGAGRVTYFFMAYLIEREAYDINQAADIGRDLKFSMPLEKLLDTEIRFEPIEK